MADRKALATKVVAAMCEHGFMNGWFGDTSPEFQAEQVAYLCDLSDQEWRLWLDRNSHNLIKHCGFEVL